MDKPRPKPHLHREAQLLMTTTVIRKSNFTLVTADRPKPTLKRKPEEFFGNGASGSSRLDATGREDVLVSPQTDDGELEVARFEPSRRFGSDPYDGEPPEPESIHCAPDE